jgi:signal transduction histidine kinase
MDSELNLFPHVMSLAVHELRTPVTVVTGYLRMLLGGQAGPLTDKQRKMLEEANRSCTRIGALVAEMSELGTLEARQLVLAKQPIDLSSLLRETASAVHEGADRGVRLRVERSAEPLVVMADRVRLGAAMTALLRAALRERSEPGDVVAACSQLPGSPAWGVVAIGEPEALPALLDGARGTPPPFDEWRGGLGLALPIARRVIELHGGATWSAGEPHRRGAAAFRLPLGTAS